MTREQIHIGDMSHETAIGILKLMLEAMETYDGISPTPERINAVKMAIESLTMSSVTPQEPKWIPVSKRLPKAGEYVGNVAKYYLVQNEYGDMLVARYTHSEYWEQMYQINPISDEIVAWMPLPKPYKAESEKDNG